MFFTQLGTVEVGDLVNGKHIIDHTFIVLKLKESVTVRMLIQKFLWNIINTAVGQTGFDKGCIDSLKFIRGSPFAHRVVDDPGFLFANDHTVPQFDTGDIIGFPVHKKIGKTAFAALSIHFCRSGIKKFFIAQFNSSELGKINFHYNPTILPRSTSSRSP